MTLLPKLTLFVALLAIGSALVASLPDRASLSHSEDNSDYESYEDVLFDSDAENAVLLDEAASNVQGDTPGLSVDYYNLGAEATKLPDFAALKPYRTHFSAQINYPSTDGDFADSQLHSHVGAVWTGFINVPESGTWTFFRRQR
jgi:hypothetical protein